MVNHCGCSGKSGSAESGTGTAQCYRSFREMATPKAPRQKKTGRNLDRRQDRTGSSHPNESDWRMVMIAVRDETSRIPEETTLEGISTQKEKFKQLSSAVDFNS